MTRKLATLVFVAVFFSAVAMAQTAAAAPAAPAASPAPQPTAPAAPAASPAPRPAASASAIKVGIINIQQAILATNEGQRDFQNLQKKFEPRRTELEANNTEVENMKKRLNDQGPKLNEDARANLLKSIEQKQKGLQRAVEDAQSEFQAQQNDIANRIGQKLLEVLEKYANDNGYSVVLDVSSPQSPVLWASTSTLITKAVVDAYNAQSNVPAATAPKPAAKPATPAPAKPAGTTKPQ